MMEVLLKDIDQMLETQRTSACYREGTIDPYMQGLYNGMEFIRSIVAKQEPVFMDATGQLNEDAVKRQPERYI